MEWNIGSRLRQISDTDLADLQEMAVDLLDLLKSNLPGKCGEKGGWNFDKAHSILHKVSEIIMWGNSDNTSCQRANTRTSTSSRRWQPASTIRMSSCAFCVFMLAEHICSTIRHCCGSWRVRKNPPQRLSQSKRPERAPDSYEQKSALCCTIGISTWPVKQVFDTPRTR